MKRRNKLEHCYRSLAVLRRSTTKCTTKPVGKMLDRLAIVFEVTAFKEAFCSLFFEVSSRQHWRIHSIPLSPPLRISFWAWADMRAKTTHALPDVRDSRTSGNCCYQSPPFRRPRDQKKRRLWGRECTQKGMSASAEPLPGGGGGYMFPWSLNLFGFYPLFPINKTPCSQKWF